VQIGDPFEEKKLIEACLDLYQRGLVVGIQDLGAAGISCATSECAANGGMGMTVDLDAVPMREADMTPGEILMSESQERMLAIVAEDDVAEVLAVADKWEIGAAVIGTVTEDPGLDVHHRDQLVAEIPAASLAGEAPIYHRTIERPAWVDRLHANDAALPAGIDLPDTLLTLLDDPALADRSWIYEQYDHQLFLNTVRGPGGDGSLLRVRGTDKGLSVSTDGDGRLCYLDPRRGAERLVFEAALNVAVTGARPYAVVDNLNFGNPEKPEVMWQFTEAIEGIAVACEALDIPVIGGNVSFYNETDGVDIYPTPVVGMLGFCDPIPVHPPSLAAAEPGMEIWEIGVAAQLDFAGSAYNRLVLDHFGGRPVGADLIQGPRVVRLATALAERGATALHDVSAGGAAIAIAEIAIQSGVGAHLIDLDWRRWLTESPHRFLAVVPPGFDLKPGDTPAKRIGVMEGTRLDFGRHGSTSLALAATTWRGALPRRMH
jgi:phosphoribosylformylglycinamidine synthase